MEDGLKNCLLEKYKEEVLKIAKDKTVRKLEMLLLLTGCSLSSL